MSGTISPDVQNLINQINNIKVNPSIPVIPNGGSLGSKLTSVGNTAGKMVNNAGMLSAKDIANATAPKANDGGFSIWDMLSGTIGQIGGAVTDHVYHGVDDIKSLFKNPSLDGAWNVLQDFNPITTIGRGIANGAKHQWDDWTDGKFTWGDIPGVGFLNGMDTGWKRGSDIMKDEVGVNNKWSKTLGGLGLDIALDPLTYLTGGLSAASKAGEASKIAKMTEIAGKNGLQVTKDMVKDPHILLDTVRQQDLAKYPNLAKVIDDKYIKNADAIDSAFNTAHNANINSWGLHVPNLPFTKSGDNLVNMIGGKQNFLKAGEYGAKNPLFRSEATLGQDFSHVVPEMFMQNKVYDPADQMKILTERYGVNNPANMTRSMVDDLHNQLQGFNRGQNAIRPLPASDLADFMKNFDGVNTIGKTNEIDKVIGNGYHALEMPTTNLEKALATKNPFDPRTFRSANDFVNSMANHHADAMNQTFGEMAKYRKDLSSLDAMKKGLKPEEEMAAIYKLEGKAPNGHTTDGLNMDKVNQYAGAMKGLFSKLSKEERGSGLLDKVMQNYFPHVKNFSDEEMKSIQATLSHPDSSALLGKSAKNAFNQERTGFKTIADRDNVINGIHKELATDGLSADRTAHLQDALDKLGKMYNLDTSQVIMKRVRESIRSRSMKMMNGEFKKFGMLKSNPKDVPVGLKLLSPQEANRLGLGKGQHYMQPEVLDGMKRVDELFTGKGMNSFMRVMNGVTSLFRTSVTVFKPSHYLNNVIGNVAINFAAGVRMKDYGKAFSLMKKWKSGAELTHSEQMIMDAAFKHNVINGGYMADTTHFSSKVGEHPNSILNKTADKLEGLNSKLLDSKVGKFARHKGEGIDDPYRLANFINGLEKNNGNVKKAAEQVRTYLFNYTENTNADRHMRAVVPFWNWMKRNIPLQLKMVMENPKYIENTQRLKSAFNENADGADYQKQGGLHIPFTNQYMNIPFPSNDLEQLGRPVSSLISSSSPFIKAPLELSSNHNYFTGNPIDFKNKTVQGNDLLPYALGQIGAFGSFAKPFMNNSNKDTSTLDKIRQAVQSYFVSLSQAKTNGN
jgi:hypothetical protein